MIAITIVLSLLVGLAIANVVILAHLVRALERTREIAESSRGATGSVEAMARNIVIACDTIRREVEAMHSDVMALGVRMTEVEGRVEVVEHRVEVLERVSKVRAVSSLEVVP